MRLAVLAMAMALLVKHLFSRLCGSAGSFSIASLTKAPLNSYLARRLDWRVPENCSRMRAAIALQTVLYQEPRRRSLAAGISTGVRIQPLLHSCDEAFFF